ncbi:MAG: hypothetical protein IKE59_04295 [Erysipelotrichaceae bacterium]|nr:hypothetical protein [Erysipelotrichaceae bacterium]
MRYEEMLRIADKEDLKVHEADLRQFDGLIWGKTVAIRHSLPTRTAKACVLAEEIGHARTCCENIIDYDARGNGKKETEGRTVGYDLLIGLDGIIRAYREGCTNAYEMAEFLGVTEEFLTDAIKRYRGKYAPYVEYNGYYIVFEPALYVLKKL